VVEGLLDSHTASSTGVVFDIQRYSIHDGPGIRTLVFMKGCPLRCIWCANPEGLGSKPNIMFTPKKCYGCGACVSACEHGAISTSAGQMHWQQERCIDCLNCATVCNAAHARRVCGQEYTVDELLGIIERDSVYYRRSKGGLTVGGGEPLHQAAFVSSLLNQAKEQLALNTAVETSSYASWEKAQMVYMAADTIQTDIKHMDDAQHKKLTGVSNQRILSNIAALAKVLDRERQTLVIRIPVIPGMNDSEQNIRETAAFAKSLGAVERIELLPYHNLGEAKYSQMSSAGEYQLHGIKPGSKADIQRLCDVVKGCGMPVHVGGL
jgi:pyruvate formate lyase activating enzyme